MTLQRTEKVNLGEIKVSGDKALIYEADVNTSVALIVYDLQNRIGGLAHIVLPESSLSNTYTEHAAGKFADTAVPALLEQFQSAGGQKRTTVVKMVGGAQLFNFGGGAGNLLNMGARTATAIRAAMSKQGLAIEKADTGGNKAKKLQFVLATGQVTVEQIGGREYNV